MNCRRMEPLLSLHLEGRLPERAARAVIAHLADCPVCRLLRDDLQSLSADLRDLAALSPPPDLERRIAARIAAAQPDPRGAYPPHGYAQRLLGLVSGSSSGSQKPGPLPAWRLALAAGCVALFGLMLARWSPGPAREHGTQLVRRADSDNLPRKRERSENANAQFPGRKRPVYRLVSRLKAAAYLTPLASTQARSRALPQDRPVVYGRRTRRAGHLVMADAGNSPRREDLDLLNGDALQETPRWIDVPAGEWDRIEARIRAAVRVRDDFVQIPFPRLASTSARQIAAAADSYKREAAIVDPRLSHEVTIAYKATALSDLCDHLRDDTGIQLSAGPSVADEKVTIFCEKLPLREVMRQLSRPFGYTWLRSKKEGGEYRYELVQDLRSQLLEEELRNRDRDAALLALDREIQKYRPYLHLSPDEALARLKTAGPEEKKLLEQIANNLGGWGPLQMYYRLSPQEYAALRAGERLVYKQDPGPGERPLPPDMARGIFQTWRSTRLKKWEDGYSTTDGNDPNGRPLSAVPEARASLFLRLQQSELGLFTLSGASGYYTPATQAMPRQAVSLDGSGPLAVGQSPATLEPENAVVNARFAHDPDLRPRMTVAPVASYRLSVPGQGGLGTVPDPHPAPKVTTADVLEALHQATHLPIVSDYYTRLYPLGAVSVRNQPLFDALNHLADAMRLRWNREQSWLQFRSVSFYDDRRKEVPNRLLARWQASRRQHGTLTLEDLMEIAQLPEEQLQAKEMAEGARDCWGLAEWEIFRNPVRHPYWRYLAEFTPDQRQKALSATGLPFTEMTLAQQQRFITVGLEWDAHPLQSLDELAGAALRVDYTVPGWFEWRPPGPDWLHWVIPIQPGREGRRALVPPVRERARESALQTARRLFPSIRERLLQAARLADSTISDAQMVPQESQIVPTTLDLTMVHIPGTANTRHLHVVSAAHGMGWSDTW